MGNSTDHETRQKNIASSILVGLACAVAAFLIVTVLAYLALVKWGWAGEEGLIFGVFVSPILGALAGIVSSLIGGIWTYKHLSAGK